MPTSWGEAFLKEVLRQHDGGGRGRDASDTPVSGLSASSGSASAAEEAVHREQYAADEAVRHRQYTDEEVERHKQYAPGWERSRSRGVDTEADQVRPGVGGWEEFRWGGGEVEGGQRRHR